MLTNKVQVDELEPSVVDNMAYHRVEENNTWRVGMVKELINMKQGDLLPPEGWSKEELETLMNFICTQ